MRTSSFDAPKKSSADGLATVQTSEGETGILSRDLMTGLMGMVPILGGKKVTVGFAGENAFCDSSLSYVNIPALPPTDVIPIQIAREIRGFAAHEAAHIAFTDNAVFPAAIVDAQGNFDKLLKEIWNCVEDFMIEKFWLELYPGAKKNFAATETRCCRGYMEMHGKNPDVAKDLRIVGPVALTWMRAIHFGLGVSASRECLQTLSPTLRQRVMDWFHDILDVETTQDCLDAARRIHADINAQPFDPADPPSTQAQNSGQQGQGQQGQGQQGQGQGASQGSGQGSGNGQTPGQGQGAGQGQGQGQGSGQGQDQQGAAGGGGGKGPGGSSGAPTAPAGPAPDPIPTSADITQVLNDAGKISDQPDWVTAEVLSTTQTGPEATQLSDPGGTKLAEAAEAHIKGAISGTATQLRRALRAAAKDRWKGGRMDGRMDDKRIAGAATGAVDLYRRKVKGDAVDTAVSILIDCSGSMDGEELRICQDLAIVLEKSLTGTPIKHEIIGFTTADVADADPAFQTMIQAHANQGLDIKARAVGLYEFRRFDQGHASALRSIGNMCAIPTGMTPTSDAILLTHDRLARRPEQRHVMFVLTDGASDDSHATLRAVRAVEACGVTVLGLGIGCDSVEREFTHSVVLSSAHDLPALMMQKLTKILLGDRTRVAQKGGRAARTRAMARKAG